MSAQGLQPPRRAGLHRLLGAIGLAYLGLGMLNSTVADAADAMAAKPEPTAVIAALREALQPILRLELSRPGSQLAIRLPDLSLNTLAEAPCAAPRVTLVNPVKNRRMPFALSCSAENWEKRASAELELMTPVPVAARALPANSVIAPADIQVQTLDLFRLPRGSVVSSEQLLGASLNRSLRSGDAFPDNALRAASSVMQGDPVMVMLNGNGFRISLSGRAGQPGMPGQTIRVVLDSGRQISGLLQTDRRVAVTLAGDSGV